MNNPDTLINTDTSSATENSRRFGGIERLYGEAGLRRLSEAHVCVIGVGGVGSWVVESLARTAVGKITMIDMDVVSVSNINRQIVATTDAVGRDKIAVMKDRVEQINPDCEVTPIDEFINRENLDQLMHKGFDYVVDCIDDYRTKAALINYCREHKIKILTVGGAGGQSDPSKVRLSDLSRTQHDVLLATTRKLLRQDYSFARNLKRSFGVPAVYSDEQAVYPDGQGGLSPQRPPYIDFSQEGITEQGSGLNCAGHLGSVTHVTATFGFFACGHIIREICCG